MILLDAETGKVLASADIAPHADEICYDAGRHVAYGASGLGKISVVEVGGRHLESWRNHFFRTGKSQHRGRSQIAHDLDGVRPKR